MTLALAPVRGAAASRSTARPAINVSGVHKAYGPRGSHVLALQDITLAVERGEFVCLVGASGCGKSTLLTLLAGLERAQAGTVETHGRLSLLFQDAALFPWLTAAQNVELALRLAAAPRATWASKAAALLELVHLHGFADRRPHELSGGMRQRTALARALAQDAEILLMDEPFGALDAMTRDLLHDELERLWAEKGLTVLFVTHDVREAVRLADRIILMTSRPGRVAEEFRVDLPRPRAAGAPEVGVLTERITGRLREEVRRHAGK
ncbi:MAG TPA: ABC transporter ATP-binding protein [Candidatus Limnocylindria bacterium]|nr:ABC transporter ATP-binding protein [Candidatus Limnocylindria bacterium]